MVDLQSVANKTSGGTVEDGERNRQLKEFYLAHALLRCDPQNAMAREVLNSYATGMQGLYARYAKQALGGA